MVVKPKARTLKYYYLPEIIKYVEDKYKLEDHDLISWLCCKLEPREDCTHDSLRKDWLSDFYWGIKPEGKIKTILEALFKEFAPREDKINIWMDWQ